MTTDEEVPPRRGGLSRRGFLLTAAGVAAAAVAVPVVIAGTRPRDHVAAMLTHHPFEIAHRGGDADWPEMSLLAYRSALALGVEAVEVSLARTEDGIWFGLHDATLDRTSGVSGFVAARHTWAQVSRLQISAAGTRDPSAPAQPYARLEDIVATVGEQAAILVDPKGAQGHANELLDLLERLIDRPQRQVVAKGQAGPQQSWALAAGARGYRTWGFYYGTDLAQKPSLLSSTQQPWTMLGLDLAATSDQWAAMRALGRPVIAHVIASPAQRRRAVELGAAGLMVSDVRALAGG